MQKLLSGWPWQARAKSGTMALMIGENSMRYVLAAETGNSAATLAAWGMEQRGSSTREAFMKRIKLALPPAQTTIAVLEPRDYQIIQVETPNVPAEELRGAVRWKTVEYLDGSPHDYTFDVLTMTGEGNRGNIIAIAAHNSLVRARMLDCAGLDHPLSVIDVAETAQRNLLRAVLQSRHPGVKVAAALIADAGRALLVITVRDELCFFRRFDFDVDMLAVPVDEVQSALISQGANAEAVSGSLMQLHRSLDLWEDSYPNLPLGIMLIDAGVKTAAIVERLRPETGVETEALDPSAIFALPAEKKTPPWREPAYLPLLGALLRSAEP